MRLDRLFPAAETPAARITLNVSDARWTARFQRLDHDSTGFRSWVGQLEGIDFSHVVFTERDGVVSGLINAISATYVLRTLSPGTYTLEKMDLSQAGVEMDPLVGYDNPIAAAASPGAADDPATIDVLMLFTPNARAAAGGTAQIQAIVSQVISDSNTIFGRSGILPRFRLVGSSEFALTEGLSMRDDLVGVSDSLLAQAMRDAARADLVQLLVNSPDLSACGMAWLLTSLSTVNFNAYSVADISCVGQYTPTHEMGHNMGSHHAPEDEASGALFPYSYGFKDPVRRFRTVMAYECAGVSCPRIPNFSNPLGSHDGGTTGTAIQNNALSINNAAETVANWRQSSGPLDVPATPTGLRSQVAGTIVSVFWDPAVVGTWPVTAYTLQVGTLPGASDLFNANVGNTTTVWGTIGAGTYFWRVIATNSAGSSAPSAESQVRVGVGCVVPGAPQNLIFSLTARVVALSWTPPLSGEAPVTYIVEAGSWPGLANLFAGSTGSANPNITMEAPPGIYFVRIRAQNACGISAPSNEQLIVVP